MFFGRPHGPFRLALAALGPIVCVVLMVTVARLDTRFANQQKANERTLSAAGAVVAVNQKVTARVGQLDQLTKNAQAALGQVQGLQPLLAQLKVALTPVVAGVDSAGGGASISNATISSIAQIVGGLAQKFKAVVGSAQQFGSEEQQLIAVIEGIVPNVQAAVADAARIEAALPAALATGQ